MQRLAWVRHCGLGYEYAVQRGYDVTVTIASNNKDAPEEIPLLLDPIAEDRADFVQGSRFLKRGASFGAMPAHRQVAPRLHPLLFSLVAGRRVTESTSGFRLVRTRVFDNLTKLEARENDAGKK
jgi:dolichol-phosphate mannosyltransferase